MIPHHAKAALALGAGLLLTACAGSVKPHVPVPGDPGIYGLLPGDELQPLGGSDDWEDLAEGDSADFGPDQQFVVSDPSLAERGVSDDVTIELWKVAWLRSDLRSDGSAAPVRGSEWAVARLDPFRIPLSFRPVAGNPDVLHLVPQRALEPGLYALQLREGDAAREARFGVQWSSIDRDDYSAAQCVDRRIGVPMTYQTCLATQTAMSSAAGQVGRGDDLAIALAESMTTMVAGQRVLILSGMVTNTASSTRAVPMLEAALRDPSGNVLGRWNFAASPNLLAPGESASFRTEIADPPTGMAGVDVGFEPGSAALTP